MVGFSTRRMRLGLNKKLTRDKSQQWHTLTDYDMFAFTIILVWILLMFGAIIVCSSFGNYDLEYRWTLQQLGNIVDAFKVNYGLGGDVVSPIKL